MTIAFVGLGRMGLAMATNLSAASYEVIGVDLDSDRQQAFKETGGRTASLSEATNEADVVIMMLRTPEQVQAVLTECTTSLSEGSTVINMSTSGVSTSKLLAEYASTHDIHVVDAPVSGGIEGAEENTLAIMAGGDPKAVDSVRHLFDILGEDVFHLGSIETGQTAKLCNQLLVGAELLSISEAFRLGEAAGIPSEDLYSVLTSCIGTSGILEQKGDRLIHKDFEPGADVNLQYKDSNLILDLAEEMETPVYLASTVAQVYSHARVAGLGDHDHFALYELLGEKDW